MAAPPPQNFPYDYLFKVLIIGDASVGKVRFLFWLLLLLLLFTIFVPDYMYLFRIMYIFVGEKERERMIALEK